MRWEVSTDCNSRQQLRFQAREREKRNFRSPRVFAIPSLLLCNPPSLPLLSISINFLRPRFHLDRHSKSLGFFHFQGRAYYLLGILSRVHDPLWLVPIISFILATTKPFALTSWTDRRPFQDLATSLLSMSKLASLPARTPPHDFHLHQITGLLRRHGIVRRKRMRKWWFCVTTKGRECLQYRPFETGILATDLAFGIVSLRVKIWWRGV